jgi:hypothetical protein
LEQADLEDQIEMENGLRPEHSEPHGIRQVGMARRMIAISEKYALEAGSPTPITSERQHEE